MFPFVDIAPLILQTILVVVLDPLFMLVVAIVAIQYHRMAKVRERFFGLKPRNLWRDVSIATVFGLLGGVMASYLMVFVGLTLAGTGLMYLWPLAILLMFIDARFLCFAYAGGILALSSLLFGWPSISVPQLLGLVAILHMVEAFLILVSGHLGAVPTFFKNDQGKIVGGFVLQKFWPIPLAALVVVGHTTGTTNGGIDMPQWWPLLRGDLGSNLDDILYSLMPVVAGLGYGDLAAARTPEQKGRISAVILGAYSLVLLALAVLADRQTMLGILAALFSPLGHEFIIYLGKRMETGKFIYQRSSQGVRVLDVVPGYPAWHAGIRSGDLLLEVNGMAVSSREGLEFALGVYKDQQITYYSNKAKQIYREGIEYKDKEMLGILPVPEGNESNYMELSTNGPLRRWLSQRFRKKE